MSGGVAVQPVAGRVGSEASGDVTASRAAWARAARDWVRRCLAEDESDAGGVRWLQLAAPLLPLESALAALRSAGRPGEEELLWDPASGLALAGVGAAATIAFVDPQRTRDDARALFDRLIDRSPAPHVGPAPRCFGAIAFAPGEHHELPWSDFGAGRFVLPRTRYVRDGSDAFLGFAFEAGALAAGRRPALLDDLDRAISALAGAAERFAPGPGAAHLVLETPRARWRTLVEEILDGIAAGRFRKVVAARRTSVERCANGPTTPPPPYDALDVVARLRESAEGCTRFLLRAGSTTFLGATPERLVARHGAHLSSEALAGSIAAGAPDAARQLLASEKDRAEHALVVGEIARRLGPWCDALAIPPAPGVRSLRHVLHLHTPIEGRLGGSAHVLDLVGALHPTPAVGGLPAADAERWIAEREGAERGLYAGPVGWFDAHGDGEFAVALRSAALWGDRAWVWAGAGIVNGSDADREYDETSLKQRGMLAALLGTP